MVRIAFSNSSDSAVFVQVDPWACLYKLEKGESIEFAMKCHGSEPSFTIDEYDQRNRILTLVDCEEFFVVVNGRQIHWEEYPSNI
ncbi:MAG: hypothetical protein KDA44_13765 [Planctomycetales bacterium]|nr:hypothetical protein [Planctomycetales bacterium]